MFQVVSQPIANDEFLITLRIDGLFLAHGVVDERVHLDIVGRANENREQQEMYFSNAASREHTDDHFKGTKEILAAKELFWARTPPWAEHAAER